MAVGASEWLEANRRRSAGSPAIALGEAQTHGRQPEDKNPARVVLSDMALYLRGHIA